MESEDSHHVFDGIVEFGIVLFGGRAGWPGMVRKLLAEYFTRAFFDVWKRHGEVFIEQSSGARIPASFRAKTGFQRLMMKDRIDDSSGGDGDDDRVWNLIVNS